MGIDPLTHQPLTPPPAAPLEHDKGHPDGQCEEPDEENKDSPVAASQVKELEECDVASFCVDEVPLIDLKEILIPCHPSSSATSSSMSTSSSSAVITHGNIFEDLEFPELEWSWDYSNDIRLWDEDFDWDSNLLIEEGTQGSMSTEAAGSTAYQIPVLDQISWAS